MLFDYSLGRRRAWMLVLLALLACAPELDADPRDVGVRGYALNDPVQSALATTTLSTSITATFASQPTAGNLLIAIKTHFTASNAITGPSGWTLAVNTANNMPGQVIYYKTAGASEATSVTIHDGANLVNTLRILEFSGFDGRNAPVVSSRTAATSSNNFAFTAVTTSAPNALLVAASINAASGISVVAPTVSSWSNSFSGLPEIVPLLRTESSQVAYRTAAAAGSYTTTSALDRGANVVGHLLAFNRLPVPAPSLIVTAGASQNVVTFGALSQPYTHVLVIAKTADCSFNATPTGSEARGSAVGNATVIFNDAPGVNSSSQSVMLSGVATNVSYASASSSLTHSALTIGTLYCYRVFVRNGAALDTESASPKTRSGTPFDGASPTSPRFVVSSGSASLSAASIIPGVGAFYADSSGKVLTVSTSGAGSYASAQLPDAVQSRGPAGVLTGDVDATLFMSSLSGDAYALWASGASAGTLRWSTVAIDGDSATSNDQPLGAALYAAPLVSKPLSRVFVGTRNAAAARNRVFAVNALSGACVWVLNGTCTGDTGALNIGQISSVPILDSTNYRLLFSNAQLSGGDTVWAIDARDAPLASRVLWSKNLGSSDSSLTFSNASRDTVLVGTNAGRIYKLDAASGAGCWGATSDGCPGAATGDEQFFCTASSVNARATSCAGGSAIQKTIVPANGAFVGNFVFSTADGYVRMVHTGGTQIWRTLVAGASPPLPIPDVGGGKVYVGGSDGLVHELSLVNGAETGTRSVGGGSVVAGAPAYDGSSTPATLHLNTSQGYQYAFSVPF